MGKSLPSATKLQQFSRIITADKHRRPKLTNPVSKARVVLPPPEPARPKGVRLDSARPTFKMDDNSSQRLPLSSVVSDCARRWFQDTLKEAKAGDISMQVLVGQMYNTGYGVPVNARKGRAWIDRASRCRSSVWRVSGKRPGYNASDSDSDDVKEDATKS